jgi:hypothetical protein
MLWESEQTATSAVHPQQIWAATKGTLLPGNFGHEAQNSGESGFSLTF